jgi:prolyl oligopeptidase
MPDIAYPETERSDLVEEHFGERIADPYRWLEGDARSDRKVVAWVEAQNAVTQEYLSTLPGRDVFRRRMTELLDYVRFTAPLKRGERYFFLRNEGVANQPSLYVREVTGGEDRLLIDPNAWSEDNADALAEWAVSDDGRFLAFGVQTGGTDWRTIKVLDVDSSKELDDAVEWVRFTRIAWAPDGSGFFYSRFPKPEGDAASRAAVANHAVYFHELGTPQAEDRLIYSSPDRAELMMHLADRAVDGRYLSIYSTPGSNESALTVVDLDATDWAPRPVFPDLESEWTLIGNDGTRLILLTTDGAERRRVVSLDLAESEPQPVEIVPEAEGRAVLNDAALLGGKLLIGYLVDAKTEIRRFRLDGTPDGTVALPGIGTAAGLTGNPAEDEAFFVFTSYNVPTTIYRYDVAANTIEPWAEPKVAIDLSRIVVEQRCYRSKDGIEVPLFLVRRKDVTRAAPTLLYGYGGFGISQIPIYNALQLAWVEQGGVVAVANIRGGGEYGRAWHRAGQLENRQNVFDDFIAAGEFLKDQRVTPPDGLAIQGESGGGLLVGAVTNQRPDLFDAALPGVGVMDMLRYHQFTGGMLWVGEYGSPDEEEHFRNLMTYSPYHTIKAGAEYPAILATTADADDRVVPAHTFKYVASLQASDIGPRPRLVRIETRAGHGAGMPLDKIIAQHADMWAFAAHWTGLKVDTSK